MGFVYNNEILIDSDQRLFAVFLVCPGCHWPITAFIRNGTGRLLGEMDGNLRGSRLNIYIEGIEPPPKTPEAPAHTPETVASFYIEACDNMRRRSWTSAASMLRKSMEVALKQFAPDIEAWKLEKRIDKLAAENLITPALKDWAHELRLDGNEALHGTEPATEELATRMERLTYFLLTYLYTLPAQVAEARQARENDS